MFQPWIGDTKEDFQGDLKGFISKQNAVYLPNIRYLLVRALYFSNSSRAAPNNKNVNHFRTNLNIPQTPVHTFPLQIRANEELLPGIRNLTVTTHNDAIIRIFTRINLEDKNATLSDRLCIDPELLTYLSFHMKRTMAKMPNMQCNIGKQTPSGSSLLPELSNVRFDSHATSYAIVTHS